jgi:1-acyl-sn-glycerol-3-phosphate acyltransferase
MKTSGLYRFVKRLARLGLQLYFSEIECVGFENLPRDKPFILAANHQNAFLDAIIAGAFLPRPLHFLTRSDVFNRFSSPWLKALQMIPIYRMRDGIQNLDRNQEIFNVCAEQLRMRFGIMVFPEANHGEDHFLRPLSKGTARMALHSQERIDDEVWIVPLGLNFFHHRRPRRKLSLVVGEPLSVKSFMPAYREHPASAMRGLKEKMTEAMKSCLIIPEPSEDYQQKKRVVFTPKNESLSFKKLHELAKRDYRHVQITAQKKPGDLGIGLASLPNFLPLWILQKVLQKFKDRVFWASMKFVVMLVLMPLWWTLIFISATISLGPWEGISLISLSVIGLFVRAELLKNQD